MQEEPKNKVEMEKVILKNKCENKTVNKSGNKKPCDKEDHNLKLVPSKVKEKRFSKKKSKSSPSKKFCKNSEKYNSIVKYLVNKNGDNQSSEVKKYLEEKTKN